MTDQPQPTDGDRERAALRDAIARKQAQEYGEAVAMALGTLGPGWTPWMKLVLIDADHRKTGDTAPVATVYKLYIPPNRYNRTINPAKKLRR